MRIVKLTPFAIALLVSIVCQAQNMDELVVRNSFWSGIRIYQGDSKLDKSQVRNLLTKNTEALELYNKGARQLTTGTVFAAIGGGLIGWPIGGAIGGADDPKWFLAGIGAGIVIIGIPIYSSGGKKISSSIELYNRESLGSSQFERLNFIVAGFIKSESIGLRIEF